MNTREKVLIGAVAVLVLALAFQSFCMMKCAGDGKPEGAVCFMKGGGAEKSMPALRGGFLSHSGKPSSVSAFHHMSPSFFDEGFDQEFGDPFQELEKIQRRMNQMFRSTFRRTLPGSGAGAAMPKSLFYEPDLDIKESPDAYVIKLDIPGMDKDKINVEVNENFMSVSGERKFEKEEEDDRSGFFQMERSFGSFHRTIPLPGDVKSEDVTAQYDKGVLTITLPKVVSEEQGKKQKAVPVQ